MAIFKPFKDVILADISRKPIGKIRSVPSRTEYQNNLIAIDYDNLKKAEECLSKDNICIIVGKMNSGKTWLSYAIGYHFEDKSKYHHTYYCQVNDFFSASDAFQDISEKEGNRKSHWLFIIDDCHQNVQECELLLQKVIDRIHDKSLHFLFITRKVGRHLLRDNEDDDYFYQCEQKFGGYIELEPKRSMQHVKNIIAKFLTRNDANNIVIDDSDFSMFYDKWKNNLFFVMLCLNSWKYAQNQKLSEINESDIHNYLWSGKDGFLLSNPQNQAFFKFVAIICQYGIYVEESILYKLCDAQREDVVINRNVIDKYKADGLFAYQEFEGKNHLSIPPHYSRIILSTMSEKIVEFSEDLDRYTVHTFIKFLRLEPVMKLHILAAIAKMSLNRSNESRLQANKIMESLLATFNINEFIGKDIHMAPHTMATLVTGISRSEIIYKDNKIEIIERLKKEYIQHNSELIKNRMKEGTARFIMQSLVPLSRLVDLNWFLSSFTDEDYTEIINRSSFNSVRLLLYSIHRKWNLKKEKKKIACAISLSDIERLIHGLEVNDVYHRANSYCQYLKEIDIESADVFVSELMKYDEAFVRLITWDSNIVRPGSLSRPNPRH